MVQASLKSDLVATIKTDTHEIIAGLPVKLGGKDEGPDPHEYLEAALASCTVLTCQLYANRKQWPLVSTDVEVKITSETKELTTIQRNIRFVGELSEEQRQRLLEIANKCPIHNLLEGKIQIATALKA